MLPHYSPLKVAESFSVLSRPVPGPDRPRHRPRARHRPADDLRAAARPPRSLRPTTSRSSSPSCSAYLDDTLPRRPSLRPPGRRCPACPSARRRGCSARRRRARSGPAELGLPYAFADFINPNGSRDRRALPRALRDTSERLPAPRVVGRRLRRSAPRARRRRSGSPPRSRMAFELLRQGQADPGAAGRRRRCASSSTQGERADGRRRPARRSSARRRRCARASRSSRGEYGAEEVMVVTITHDHERPPALLRADRGGLRGRFRYGSLTLRNGFVNSRPRSSNFSMVRAHPIWTRMYPRLTVFESEKEQF